MPRARWAACCAIREGESFPQSLGKNTFRVKVGVFGVSSALTAIAGSLYAHYASYIDPTSFTIRESVLILTMVILGGAGSVWGPVCGAIVLILLPEVLRFVGLPGTATASLRQVIYGGLLVAMMLVRPTGLVGSYGFGDRRV